MGYSVEDGTDLHKVVANCSSPQEVDDYITEIGYGAAFCMAKIRNKSGRLIAVSYFS